MEHKTKHETKHETKYEIKQETKQEGKFETKHKQKLETKLKSRQNKKNGFPGRILFVLLATVLLTALAMGISILGRYTQEQLYEEASAQLTEITEQLFEKLTVQLDIQWGYLEKLEQERADKSSMTQTELADFLGRYEKLLRPANREITFLAVDTNGYYYTDEGQQGVWQGAENLDENDRKSFLIADWLTNENEMVFARRLTNPFTVDKQEVTHFVLLRSMDDMTPFFRSSAFDNQNTTYVIDANGSKMFADNVLPEIAFEGRNLYYAMREQIYPHMDEFDRVLEQAKASSFACTDVLVDKNSYYLVIKSIEGYDWSMISLVPEAAVAVSTRNMIDSLIQLFVIIVIVLVAMSIVSFFFVMRFRKNKELLAVKIQSEQQLAQANERLERSNKELGESNQKLEEAQAAVAEALAAAKSASKAKSDFLANMSHDIRTPMNAIIGITALIEHDASSPQKVREYTAKINQSGQHLLGLINEVLDMSKIESGKLAMNKVEFNLKDLLDQVEMSFRPQMESKKQKFIVKEEGIIHRWLWGDNVRVMQILNNLLSNAFKYTQEGGTICLTVQELRQSSEHYAKLCFRVSDNGMGMSPEFVARIYDSFSREERTTINAIQGTGLGMSIVKSLIDLMGGSIDVESKQGKGTTFEVILAFKISEKGEEAATNALKAVQPEEEASLNGMHFLCAEDNALNAEILSELLDIEGATCEICKDGKAVLERFEASKPGEFDMILMDIQMPIMNGYDATKAIRASNHVLAKSIPIIAMTANAFSEDVQHSLNAGMNAHVSKPVDMKVLAKTVHSVQNGGGGKAFVNNS